MSSQSDISDEQGLTPERILNSTTVYKGRIWSVVSKTFKLHGDELTRDFIDHPGAVAILAVNHADQVLVIRQYRAPVNEFLIEIPAGLTDISGESPLETAQRELLEEADYRATTWQLLQIFHTSPGSSSETIHIYLATDLEKVEHDYQREGEEKHLQVDWVPFQDLLEAVLRSNVKSPTLVMAILSYAARKYRND